MAGIATTKTQADAELERLREDRGVRGKNLHDSALISSLDQALNILSDQLYRTPTHFLLEMIQNADDNNYDSGVAPTLHLVLYRKDGQGYFRSDCNEVGFSFQQLDALTRVGQSTKKSIISGQKGYIGEKGIGFKSVFKVADIVHIASGFYEFKLDRNKPIGMLLPIPSQFPATDRIAKHTQFCLELKHQISYQQIQKELENIEPQLLIFLQKLGKIHVSTPGTTRIYSRRVNKFDYFLGGETVTISMQDNSEGGNSTKSGTYIVERGLVKMEISEPRREGVKISEVMVAFPLKQFSHTPVVSMQKAYAFLPIGNFDFRFLIHADFLLVASRESLEYSLPWNETLRKGIRSVFLKAVRRFVTMPMSQAGTGLRYSWPKFLPRLPRGSQYWAALHKDILNNLQHEEIIESRNKDAGLQRPVNLFHVPSDFRFNGGTLFDIPSIQKSHLAFMYDDVSEILPLIGVRTLSIHDLYEEFCVWMNEDGRESIKSMSHSWHKQVSFLFSQQWSLADKLMNLPIIPLRDGSWVTARQKHLYLPAQNKEHVPNGVEIAIVDEAAAQDPTRRRFFSFLKLVEYEPKHVCDLIIELHTSGSSPRSMSDLVSDAAYLFNHRYLLPRNGAPHIWFAVKISGTYTMRQSQIYFIHADAEPDLINKHKDAPGSPFSVLSEKYEEVIGRGEKSIVNEFHEWLLQSPTSSFQIVPVLVRGGRLTDEYRFLHRRNRTDLLQAVKFHWNRYNRPPLLLKSITELPIRCKDGTYRSLGLLALPTKDLVRECPHLDFVNLPSPTTDNWSFLSDFGVLTCCGTTARIRELQALSELPLDEIEKDVVHAIYRNLNVTLQPDQEDIQSAFRNHALVFIMEPRPQWVKHIDCVWSAPEPLKQIVKLQPLYKDCKNLFRDCLQVKKAGIQSVVNELCSMADEKADNPVERFEELMSLMNHFCSKASELSVEETERIRAASVFPITMPEYASRGISNIDLRSMHNANWYIADDTRLEAVFRGKVELLSLSVKTVTSLIGLLKQLDCKDMLLSSAAKEKVEPIGESIRAIQTERDLKTRLSYGSYLSANGHIEYKELISQICVWSVPSIRITRNLGLVEVIEDNELLTIQNIGDMTYVYFCEDLQPCQQPKISYQLVKHFSKLFEIDKDNINLFNLLMNASVSELPRIMKEHNVFVSDGRDEEDNDSQGTESEEIMALPDRSDSEDDGKESWELNENENRGPSELGTSHGEVDGTHSESPSTRSSYLLGDLVPSHEKKTEKVVQKAINFQLSDSLIAGLSTYTQSAESFSGPSLSFPIRSRNVQSSLEYSHPPVQQPQQSPRISHAELEPDETFKYTSKAKSHNGGHYRPRSTIQRDTASSSVYRSTSISANDPISPRDIRYKEIGFLGECFVYELLKRQLGDWSFHNWTSALRVEAGHPRFAKSEGDFADFTYIDSSNHMREVLQSAGVELHPSWSKSTTYHLETKTTQNRCSEIFYVSQNQVNMMRRYHNDPNNAYILIRVYDECSGIKFFPQPWGLFMDRVLDFKAKEGYEAHQIR